MPAIRVLPGSDAAAALDACAAALDAGSVVALPTRRWYMLCADSTDPVACRRIFDAKGRPAGKPLALVMPSTAAVAARFTFSPAAARLAERLWPGDLALLLPWRNPEDGRRHPWLGEGAAMVTRDPGLLGDLAARTRNPPATSVVSRSDGRTPQRRAPALSPAAVQAFAEAYDAPVELLVDGGVCPLGVGLTVVDCAAEPTVVRVGAVHPRAVEAALGEP
ncbi:L-threonylcarbamoyladenylate synthase [Micromonospora sp. NPDC092111]|uniref:L-threonylcarbamoyladenylate synthase n=1 Tax=Micromonospora sp. NPDC092111 TaxID=3364289 RepID=UPI00380976D1